MKIACLSGKGGAGKTFVAVNLAASAKSATYIDCDVEEPNGRLFFKPEQVQTRSVSSLLPVFDAQKCTGCKACVRFCCFNALVYVMDKPMLFPEICHSCGGCKIVCPEGAITEAPRPIGNVEMGKRHQVDVVSGVLNPGEASGIPVIKAALACEEGLTIVDCPPGSACSVMESVEDADYCVLVAEPTAFGLHNLKMVHELASLLGRRCGVVINKQDEPYEPLETYCAEQGLEVLARIPHDLRIAELCADAQIAVDHDEPLRALFADMLARIEAKR